MPPATEILDAQPARPVSLRPTFRFMASHPAHWIALGFGSGLSRFAPGTSGTLWAWAVFVMLERWAPGMSQSSFGWLILLSLPVGWWACSVTARHMNVADPGAIVWDEIVAFWLILWLVTPAGLVGQAVAFALFRYFDAAKPGPVKWADGLFKQRDATPGGMRWWYAGFGIILDDLVAAFCALFVIAVWRAAF
jgi:phosphatidylglycerophosphatase A